ncbi:MAG: hypothetical protein PHG06_00655 [Parabacteroides sp.]|nr:hypothetical protein [Parabacteroides sp.]
MKMILIKIKSCYDCTHCIYDYEKESGDEWYGCDKTGSIIIDLDLINSDCPLEDYIENQKLSALEKAVDVERGSMHE